MVTIYIDFNLLLHVARLFQFHLSTIRAKVWGSWFVRIQNDQNLFFRVKKHFFAADVFPLLSILRMIDTCSIIFYLFYDVCQCDQLVKRLMFFVWKFSNLFDCKCSISKKMKSFVERQNHSKANPFLLLRFRTIGFSSNWLQPKKMMTICYR